MGRIKVFSVIFCFFCITTITHSENKNTNFNAAQYSVIRQIQYSFTLQNKSNNLLKKVEFWTYAPVKQTAAQRSIKVESSHPYKLIEDGLGNQILHFTFENLSPYASKIVTITADIEFSDISNPISADSQSFLKEEKYIESDNPEIKQLSKKFGSATPVKTSENIYQWVSENIKYMGYLKDERGAFYALKNKEGDCTEFADLFVALSRANSIPARSIGGYVYGKNSILKASDYHNWAEFYDDGVWKIADPQKKVFARDQSDYIAMRIIGESPNNPMGEFNRFRFEGEGLKVRMN
jgi:transglutaminase-like putative cysteine protease